MDIFSSIQPMRSHNGRRWSANSSTNIVQVMEADNARPWLTAIPALGDGIGAVAVDLCYRIRLWTAKPAQYRRKRKTPDRIRTARPARCTRHQIRRLAKILLQDTGNQCGVPHDHQRQVGHRAVSGPYRPDR